MQAFVENCRDKTVILSGCGGGCDVYGSALFFHAIKDLAKRIIFVNLSFTSKGYADVKCEKMGPGLYLANPGTKIDDNDYFPEGRFANFVGLPCWVFCKNTTIQGITDSYQTIFGTVLQGGVPDVLVLVDGGCDVLLTGNETGLATPVEDMMHVAGVRPLKVPEKYIMAIGTTVDVGHGVVPAELDARLAQLEQSGALVFSQLYDLSPQGAEGASGSKIEATEVGPDAARAAKTSSPSYKARRREAEYFAELVKNSNPIRTIVQSLTVAAMEGHTGYYTPPHLAPRIGRSVVPLSDQTRTLFCYHLDAVADSVTYLHRLTPPCSLDRVCDIVSQHIAEVKASRRDGRAKKDDFGRHK